MMGPYHYYDTGFIDDITQNELHIHDCMWSGECYVCQSNRLACPNAPPCPASVTGTVPITVGGTGCGSGYIIMNDNHLEPNGTDKRILWQERANWQEKVLNSEEKETREQQYCSLSPTSTTSPSSPPSSASTNSQSLNSEDSNSSMRTLSPEVSPVVPRGRATRSGGARKCLNKSNNFSSTDNKKLRHREVEKNRHRQLQAMVKTLSDQIPGKLDKETQVQTMKRAARYCIFLRDVLNVITHENDLNFEDKLEKLYVKSCETVELMMSQQMSTR